MARYARDKVWHLTKGARIFTSFPTAKNAQGKGRKHPQVAVSSGVFSARTPLGRARGGRWDSVTLVCGTLSEDHIMTLPGSFAFCQDIGAGLEMSPVFGNRGKHRPFAMAVTSASIWLPSHGPVWREAGCSESERAIERDILSAFCAVQHSWKRDLSGAKKQWRRHQSWWPGKDRLATKPAGAEHPWAGITRFSSCFSWSCPMLLTQAARSARESPHHRPQETPRRDGLDLAGLTQSRAGHHDTRQRSEVSG